MTHKIYIDLEPEWVDLVYEWHKIGKISDDIFEMVTQMAQCCDAVRQAQKQGKKTIKI